MSAVRDSKQECSAMIESNLPIREVAILFGVDERTIRRWCEQGLPRSDDGTFPFPMAGLWWLVHCHRQDPMCDVDMEKYLLSIGFRAIKLADDDCRSVAHLQHLIQSLTAFGLSEETIDALRQK